MVQEREPQKEPIQKDCSYCGPGHPATWEIISAKGNEFVCNRHHLVLQLIHAIQKEKLLFEVEWRLESSHEDYLSEHEFDDTDRWEDGSLYDF